MSLPVLMYHHILPQSGYIALSIAEFERQLHYLADKNYCTLTSQQFYMYKQKKFTPPAKSVLLTFDDGWRNNLIYAYPRLKQYGFRATLFIVTEWADRASEQRADFEPLSHAECMRRLPQQPHAVTLSWQDLEQMRDVFDIHLHTHTHREGLFIPLDWQEEFSACRSQLKKCLGIESTQLCWPRGHYTAQLMIEAKKAGFDCFYTTQRGVNLPDGQLDSIRRIAVKGGTLWLAKTLALFSSPLLGKVYSRIKPSA